MHGITSWTLINALVSRDSALHCCERWTQFFCSEQALQSELNAQIFEDLIQFVGKAQDGFVIGDGCKSSSTEIPTAALITGDGTCEFIFAQLFQTNSKNVLQPIFLNQTGQA